jgi:hypothetical protein
MLDGTLNQRRADFAGHAKSQIREVSPALAAAVGYEQLCAPATCVVASD